MCGGGEESYQIYSVHVYGCHRWPFTIDTSPPYFDLLVTMYTKISCVWVGCGGRGCPKSEYDGCHLLQCKIRHNLCLVQYHFDGEVHEVNSRSHGNSKVERPYARSMKSLHEKLKQSGGKATPKDALTAMLKKSGGLLEPPITE